MAQKVYAAKIQKEINRNTRTQYIMAQTIYGETRGERLRVKEAIAAVIMNRHTKNPNQKIEAICMDKEIFECWKYKAKQLQRVMATDPEFQTCSRVAGRALKGLLDDLTHGAIRHHKNDTFPLWTHHMGLIIQIDPFFFYQNKE